jgi:hypothetical protein
MQWFKRRQSRAESMQQMLQTFDFPSERPHPKRKAMEQLSGEDSPDHKVQKGECFFVGDLLRYCCRRKQRGLTLDPLLLLQQLIVVILKWISRARLMNRLILRRP